MAESKYYGLYQGVVTNINDPEKRGRIKVKCPDVLGGSTESAWCDPLVPVAYDNGGDFCIPAKDETVWLQFIAGDANRPVWLGGWWQSNMTPLGGNYSSVDKVRIISYADCTITMQDGKININVGSGSYDMRIEDGNISIDGDLIVHGKVTAGELEINTEDGFGNVKIANELNVIGTSLFESDVKLEKKLNVLGKTTVKSLEVSEDTTIKGNVEVDGDISATGNISSTGDVTTSSISLNNHTHGGVESGSASTSAPK